MSNASDEDLSWNDVSQRVIEWMRIDIGRVNWFSTYRVHHRVADHFRLRRAFLVGDAAHIHSPVGGQGMNTGIGDAVNLAWKLAAVLDGRADASLLDSYEPERMAFARRLVATTDQAFTGVTSAGAIARLVRLHIVPILFPAITKFPSLRRLMFRTISQTAVNYRGSSLSEGRAGTVHGGDRLPWVKVTANGADQDNFTSLTSLDWQVHVYGDATPGIQAACDGRQLAAPRLSVADGDGSGRLAAQRDVSRSTGRLCRSGGPGRQRHSTHVLFRCAKTRAEEVSARAHSSSTTRRVLRELGGEREGTLFSPGVIQFADIRCRPAPSGIASPDRFCGAAHRPLPAVTS